MQSNLGSETPRAISSSTSRLSCTIRVHGKNSTNQKPTGGTSPKYPVALGRSALPLWRSCFCLMCEWEKQGRLNFTRSVGCLLSFFCSDLAVAVVCCDHIVLEEKAASRSSGASIDPVRTPPSACANASFLKTKLCRRNARSRQLALRSSKSHTVHRARALHRRHRLLARHITAYPSRDVISHILLSRLPPEPARPRRPA